MTVVPDPDYAPEFYASVPSKRLMAWVLDSVFVLLLCSLLVVFSGFIGLFFIAFLFFIVNFAYRVITIANASATWGMRVVGIELRDSGDRRLDLGLATLHTATYSFLWSFPLLQMISVVLMATSARGQGLADLLFGTVMLNQRA